METLFQESLRRYDNLIDSSVQINNDVDGGDQDLRANENNDCQ